jgi:CDP-diacylglycerol--glycerol-3-phosphate 3-phosphatidyltransferase
MAKIFNVSVRAVVARICDPPARALLRAGVSPDAVTLLGTAGVIAGALYFGFTGNFLAGTVIITLSAFTDLIDGAMARARGPAGKFGAFLDSTCDRVADGATFGAVAWWLAVHHRGWGAAAAIVSLVAGQVVSYAKARAESLGMTANVGLVERAERLILIGIGGLLSGFGVTYGLDYTLGVLAVLSIVTIGQRVLAVRAQDRANLAAAGRAPQPATAQGTGTTKGIESA